jgi:hypothetical protein
MSLMLPPVAVAGLLKYEWVDPGGTVRDLTWETSPARFVSRGSIGLGMPPIEPALDKLPFAPGSLPRRINTQPGRIELPITIVEDAFADLIDVIDDLRGWFDTGDERLGLRPGYLRVTRPDGTIRQVACYYAGGLEGDMSTGGPAGTTVVISLIAPDPYPTEAADTVLTWHTSDLPEVIMINQGQLEAYPIWEFTAPFGTIERVENMTTGHRWKLAVALAGVRHLIVDTRPPTLRSNQPPPGTGRQAYTTDTNTNLYQYFDPNQRDLWWLASGENRMQIVFSGSPATTAATTIRLSYRARYRGQLR